MQKLNFIAISQADWFEYLQWQSPHLPTHSYFFTIPNFQPINVTQLFTLAEITSVANGIRKEELSALLYNSTELNFQFIWDVMYGTICNSVRGNKRDRSSLVCFICIYYSIVHFLCGMHTIYIYIKFVSIFISWILYSYKSAIMYTNIFFLMKK